MWWNCNTVFMELFLTQLTVSLERDYSSVNNCYRAPVQWPSSSPGINVPFNTRYPAPFKRPSSSPGINSSFNTHYPAPYQWPSSSPGINSSINNCYPAPFQWPSFSPGIHMISISGVIWKIFLRREAKRSYYPKKFYNWLLFKHKKKTSHYLKTFKLDCASVLRL